MRFNQSFGMVAAVAAAMICVPAYAQESGRRVSPHMERPQRHPTGRGPSRRGPRTDSRAAVSWPRGWIEVEDDLWYPADDAAGRSLHGAREAYRRGRRAEAARRLERAARALARERVDASERDPSRRPGSARDLRAAAARLRRGDDVSQRELDRLVGRVQREALEGRWTQTESPMARYHERAGAQYGALRRAMRRGPQAAARELARLRGVLALESASIEGPLQRRLRDHLSDLLATEQRLRDGIQVPMTDLSREVARVELDMASHYRSAHERLLGEERIRAAGHALEAWGGHLANTVALVPSVRAHRGLFTQVRREAAVMMRRGRVPTRAHRHVSNLRAVHDAVRDALRRGPPVARN